MIYTIQKIYFLKNVLVKFLSKSLLKISGQLNNFSELLIKLSTIIYPFRSINNIDHLIKKLLPSILNKSTFFIEVGANDGITQSNTFFLEKIYNARGLLIEPSQSNFEKCLSNRAKDNLYENCALVDSEYDDEYIDLIYSDLMTITSKDSLRDTTKHLKKSRAYSDKPNYSFSAKAYTLSKILDKYKIKIVDFLSLDVEGFELSVLKGIDFDKHHIRNILVETENYTLISSFLNDKGFVLVKKLTNHDYLFSFK